jgi:hypothetical protein
MHPAAVAGLALLLVVLLVIALAVFTRGLRARGRAEIDKRFAASDVLLAETLALSFGQESKGVAQLRGNGALALTRSELCFVMYVPTRELRIPLASIRAASLVRSHLGKTQGSKLLHVRFTNADGEDAIAWRLPNPDAWKAKLDSLRG